MSHFFHCQPYFFHSLSFIGWKESFSVIIGGEEVRMGKPSPEM